MENTDRGYEVRDYFIECEKKLHRVISSKQHCFLDILEAEDDIDRLFAIRRLDKAVIKPLEQFNTKWTQRGRLFIYEVLKDKNILPICERSPE